MSKKRFDDIPFGGKFTASLNLSSGYGKVNIGTGYEIDKVIYSNRATIVFWSDGTKTISKYNENDVHDYNETTGLIVAVLKKLVKPSEVKQLLVDWLPDETQNQVTISDVRKKHRLVKAENITTDKK